MSYQQDIVNVANLDLPWAKLSGFNILITGATGLIGSCLVEILMSRKSVDFNVYALGRNSERAKSVFNHYLNEPNFHFIQHDITHPLTSNVQFHYIIHAASNASPNFFVSNPVEVIQSNIQGIVNLMEYGKSHGLSRLLYVSSGEVYGEGDGRVFTEDYSGYVDCNKARSCYPSGKRAAETMCAAYGAEYEVDYVIARPCHIYGPHFTELDNRVYAQFIRNILNDEDVVMKSTGEQFRSWCYVVDCASALLFILLKGTEGEAYNIADENSNVTIKELAEMIAEIGGKKVGIGIPTDIERSGNNVVTKSVFSTDKIKKLGWTPTSDMRNHICSTINYMKNV